MKSLHQTRVEFFMGGVGQEIPVKPTIPSREVRELRARLIMEEAIETCIALGFEPEVDFMGDLKEAKDYEINMIPIGDWDENQEFIYADVNLEEIIDGCADISVVTTGTLSACGIPDLPVLEEVDQNNILKIETGHRNPVTGKWEKAKDHPKPDFKKFTE